MRQVRPPQVIDTPHCVDVVRMTGDELGPLGHRTNRKPKTVVRDWRVRIEQISGNPRFDRRQLHDQATHMITGRWCGEIKTTDKIIFGSRQFSIVSVDNVGEMNRRYDIQAGEQVT